MDLQREIASLAQAPSVPPGALRVPPQMLRYHAQTVQPVAASARVVRIFQRGQMRFGPDKPWLPFTAVENFSTRHIGFVWKARVKMAPLVTARVVDRYTRGHGELDARVLGLFRVAHAEGADADQGELARYLAEIPWVPQAIVDNAELEWLSIDERAVEVSAGAGLGTVRVALHFDEAGDIVRATAVRRRGVRATTPATPWGGELSAYAELGGLRVPTHAEAWWEPAEGRFTYWRGDVVRLEVLS